MRLIDLDTFLELLEPFSISSPKLYDAVVNFIRGCPELISDSTMIIKQLEEKINELTEIIGDGNRIIGQKDKQNCGR